MLPLLLAGLAVLGAPTPAPAWRWPVPGSPTVDRPFEPPRTTYGAGHRGVDLREPAGTPVLAAGDGTVTYVGLLAGRGVVTVSHAGGLRTTYEPVAASVRLGQSVGPGARLGTVTTGHASCRMGTTCLHWGLLRGATYLDPLSLLGRTRVRLLPLGAGAGATTRAGAGPRRAVPRPPSARSGQAGRLATLHLVTSPALPGPLGGGTTTFIAAGSTAAAAAGSAVLWARRRRQRASA